MLHGKVLVAQGGGPTAVINESMVGTVIESRKIHDVEHVYGAQHGVRGIINEDFLDLTQETRHNLELVAKTPCSALGSTRDKPDRHYCQEILRVLQAHEITTFFYIGGNDSSDTLRIVAEEAQSANYPLICVHIPKTVDNDLENNDHSPGYGSAARFVACAFAGINRDNWALPGVYIGAVMGRHAGFLVASSALGRRYADDGPHLIYMPERHFSRQVFLDDVKKCHDKYGRCIVAVSEGIQDENGVPIAAKLSENIERDQHGNVQLSGSGALAELLAKFVRQNLDVRRTRADTLGYVQRSFLGCVSNVDQREAREVGEKAVQYAHWEGRNGSVTIERCGSYACEYHFSPLESVAGKTRFMPEAYINEAGNNVTEEFWRYLRPLLGEGLPDSFRLRANMVEKIVNKGGAAVKKRDI